VDDNVEIAQDGGGEDERDEMVDAVFSDRRGSVDVVAWNVTEEIEYRLYFGRLSRKWGIASWGLVTLNRGVVVNQAAYNDRPAAFTQHGMITWLIESGVDAGAALQLTDLAVEARADLFRDDQSAADEPGNALLDPLDDDA
jgi:hypothetical protein